MAPSDLVVGVDCSTQSTKVEAREIESGAVVARGQHQHSLTQPPVSEQDPDEWWNALVGACTELGDARRRVVAMSVAGQQHGLVITDAADVALRPAKLWNDTTSATEATMLVEALGPQRWAELCGSVPVSSFTVSKLAWMARNEPDLLDDCKRIGLPHDHLTLRLSGEFVTDRGDASGTGWFNPAADPSTDSDGGYVPELLRCAVEMASDGFEVTTGTQNPDQEEYRGGFDADALTEKLLGALPMVVGFGDQVGRMRPEAASELGFDEFVLIGPGTGDNMAAALGVGLEPGDVVMSLGTSGTIYCRSEGPTNDESGAVAGFADATGMFLPLVCTLNATKVTETIAGWLGMTIDEFAEAALECSDQPLQNSSPIVIPYFDGERTPNRPDSTGSLFGLTNSTTPAQIALAAHDGVLCGLFDGRDALDAAGAGIDGRLLLVGGGSRSSAYRQRTADLHGSEIFVPKVDEAVAAGAALQAAAIFTGESLDDLARAWKLADSTMVMTAESRRDEAASVRARYREIAADLSW